MPIGNPIGRPIWNQNGAWTRLLASERLRRSSQVLSVIDNTAYIFGGEVQPRQPVDNQIDAVSLRKGTHSDAHQHDTKSASSAPSPRVGSSSVALNGRLYLFSGRGGVEMASIEEHGAIWCYDPAQSSWTLIKPTDAEKPYPPGRSYHCATTDGENTIYVHAGCPAEGRLSDLWKFDVATRTWTQAPDAPAPQRGGTSIAYNRGKLYRMHGFDGSKEQGGGIDVFDVTANTWSTQSFNADGNDGPEPRSVCALVPIVLAKKDKLLTLFGERDPSSLGHAGAGKMLSDVWVYDIDENWWTKLEPKGNDGQPAPRGWFDADVVKAHDGNNDHVVVHGGLGENNERLTDIWLLSF
ncbi:galactose oxidase [Massarina eburnea CBS 473.64]|uniref:Galactose oxidase n=1 Tax=Massarina eburnea CBS 473.64 TaxID=1395130 RepID=A0A6A6RSU1_9PLEO|nr:galactose oxidase [Massarina eburnea CBS 473.64]